MMEGPPSRDPDRPAPPLTTPQGDWFRPPAARTSPDRKGATSKLISQCSPDATQSPTKLGTPCAAAGDAAVNLTYDGAAAGHTAVGLTCDSAAGGDAAVSLTCDGAAAGDAAVSLTCDGAAAGDTAVSLTCGGDAGTVAGGQLRQQIGDVRGVGIRTPPEEDDAELFIPLDEEDWGDDHNRRKKKKLVYKRKQEKDETPVTCDLDQDLERALEDGAKQHNLTAVNVRNILHEVITNEHVVAMMKAAIAETEGLPPFEPKMTRSKLKEVTEKGVVIPTWNLSPIKKSSKQQVPQFVDIPLEEEDSSDEEYQPEEEEEDETAEESLLESDVESTVSSPRGPKRMRVHQESPGEESMEGQQQQGSPQGAVSLESLPMGPPPPPRIKEDRAFMEKLHAVDEELHSHLVPMDSFQALDESLIAFRTRSKRPLKNVPIGKLEAELKAPDITPDMYEANTADDEYWKDWLRGLMQDDVGNEDEAEDDDDDDPEYNILEDWDEPDTEDLRNDRAVRITKKEVNELMEELFETFQDEMGISHLEDEGADDEDSNLELLPDFNTPQAIRFEEPLANLLTEQHRTVRAQLEYLRMRKSLMTKSEEEKLPARESQPPASPPNTKVPPIMSLDSAQRKRLQQQMQQHVQLLTQLHLLSFRNPKLSTEAETAHLYLAELSTFAESSALTHGSLIPGFQSTFQACNLKEALELIPLVHSQVTEDVEPPKPTRKSANDVPSLPKHLAWILATRPVFMYPELLPVCAMKPRGPQDRVFFTKAEDNLLALGLKHFEGIEYSKQLISKYLLTAKTAQQLTVRIKNLTMKKVPDNIIKFYRRTKTLPSLGRCCEDILPHDARPPVEREKHRLPFWIKASLSSIEAEMKKCGDSRYPLILPLGVSLTLKPLPRRFYSKSWRQRRSALKPLLIRPVAKSPAPQSVPIRILGQVPPLIQPAAMAMQGIINIQPVSVPAAGRKAQPIPCGSASFNRRPLKMSAHPAAAILPQTQVVLPAVAAPRARKSLICALPKRKAEAKTLGSRATPTIHSAPVLLAVPHGALKLVSLGPGCGVLQPLCNGGAVPMTTVLLNPGHAPLNQTHTPPPCPQTPASPQPHVSGQKSEEERVAITVKEEGGDSWSGGEEAALQGRGDEHVTPKKEESDATHQGLSSVPLQTLAAASPVSKTEDPREVQEPEEVNHAPNPEAGGDSPEKATPTTSSSTDGDMEVSSPPGAQRDSSSPMDGQDLGNDKDVPEEEEDEDFDDLTQDEDEMSSEESVLSVPELQETMEKLTWLASERRLSQEGDSEDNSQEENSEPEEEEEGADATAHKPEEMADEAEDRKRLSSHHRVPSPAPMKANMAPAERRRGGNKGQNSHKVRSRRGRARTSKDASKLLLLYDEKILSKDPLREQKDMAFAQAYLNRVREALQSAPGTYQQFLNLIYQFESKGGGRTAVDLYKSLRLILQQWPQLLKDFAAFLLPEQALECGLFEEQQAFDKSRRFLRQLEICFQDNPAQHHKIIRLLQSCAECPLQEVAKLKTQMWQLLKGHTHLQEEFSLFFDQLRPPPSRMEDFEVMNWTEDKEYTFDGFEEVTIPDVEEEEEQSKVVAPQRSKRRKDAHHGADKDADWLDGGKDCSCSCHDVGVEQRIKRCKRRMCAQCTSKGCDSRSQRSGDPVGVSTIKDTGDSRLPLLKSLGSDERSGARAPPSSSVAGQRPRSGADTAKVRHRGASSRGGRRLHCVTSVGDGKILGCPSEPQVTEQPDSPGRRSPPCSPPTTSSALHVNPAPEDPALLQDAERDEQTLTMCAKNIKLSSSGEKVVVWTREADRVILTMCQEWGAHDDTFTAISTQLSNKSPAEVSQRFRELVHLFQTACVTSSDDEEEGMENASEEEEED
ncbi:GON-4-like protein isoform X2 [Dendropsophus ebraccatus]|uniref:GON-4-like protein isoform X2 n=1 Tax=Dendropsophus ebraccatus TaxID=150705 RepID=UPI00383193E5